MPASNFSLTNNYLIVDTHADPDEVLKVKHLSGRKWNSEQQRWFVPILPGLAREVELIYQLSSLAALIEDLESRVIERMRPATVNHANLWDIPADEAIQRACDFHLMDFHHGDIQDYRRVHYDK